jgi:cysteine desulfurase
MADFGNFIYFDNNATTPVDQRVLEAMLPFLKSDFANASSSHLFGQSINKKVHQAREEIASFLNAEPNEIVFTSGATEAINIALKGVASSYASKGKHIVTVSTEHYAVLDTCKYLEDLGFEVSYLSVSKEGLIDLCELRNLLRADTILVSVMYVNNETGVIQPLKEISDLVHEAGALFMSDTTQAAGKLKVDVKELGIDILCLSGHKMYAPKGIGVLFFNQSSIKVRLTSFVHGGGHERGYRSGTLNVPGIIALAKACEIAKNEMKQDEDKISILRNSLEEKLLHIEGSFVNGSRTNRIYNTTNICFPHVDASVLIGRLGNVAVSNGSACASAIVEPSRVLTSMGLSKDDAFCSIRFSLGRFSSFFEVQEVCSNIYKTYSSILQEYDNR